MLSGTVKFTSYSVPVEERADPEVEQFDWLYESATYDNTLDESYVLAGHRKTGFSEDDHQCLKFRLTYKIIIGLDKYNFKSPRVTTLGDFYFTNFKFKFIA